MMDQKTLWFQLPGALHRQLKSMAALRAGTIAAEGRRAVESHVANGGTVLCGNGALLCPNCSENADDAAYLHFDRVTVHAREEDGDPDTTVVEFPDRPSQGAQRPSQHVPSNPSRRRSGIVVEGWCEHCSGRWELTLAQHKGQTLITAGRSAKTVDAGPTTARAKRKEQR